MSDNCGEGEAILKKIETFLNAGPEGHDVAALHDFVVNIKTLRRESEVDALEYVMKLLGTAAGQQSKVKVVQLICMAKADAR